MTSKVIIYFNNGISYTDIAFMLEELKINDCFINKIEIINQENEE